MLKEIGQADLLLSDCHKKKARRKVAGGHFFIALILFSDSRE